MTQSSGQGSHRGPEFAAPLAPPAPAAPPAESADGATYARPPRPPRRPLWPWLLTGLLALVAVVGTIAALVAHPGAPTTPTAIPSAADTPMDVVAKQGACYRQVSGVRWAETPCDTKDSLAWKASTVARFGVANACPGPDYRLLTEAPKRPGRQYMCLRPLLAEGTCYGPWHADMEVVRAQACGPEAPKVTRVAKSRDACAADEQPLEFAKDAVVYCLRG